MVSYTTKKETALSYLTATKLEVFQDEGRGCTKQVRNINKTFITHFGKDRNII